MPWELFASACGSLHAAKSAAIRISLHRNGDSWATLCANYLWALPALMLFWLSQGHPWEVSNIGSLAVILSAMVVAELIAQYVYGLLIAAHPLSRIMPFLRLTGVATFLLYVMAKGGPLPISAFIGITTVCLGLVLLGSEREHAGIPFRVRDALFIGVVISLWSITSVLQKEGVAAAGNVSVFALGYVGLSAVIAFFVRECFSRRTSAEHIGINTAIGTIGGISYLCQYAAMALAANPGYVLAVKDTFSSLGALAADKVIFKSQLGVLRIAGNGMCIIGSVLISIALFAR